MIKKMKSKEYALGVERMDKEVYLAKVILEEMEEKDHGESS